jgi:hypothetical protein
MTRQQERTGWTTPPTGAARTGLDSTWWTDALRLVIGGSRVRTPPRAPNCRSEATSGIAGCAAVTGGHSFGLDRAAGAPAPLRHAGITDLSSAAVPEHRRRRRHRLTALLVVLAGWRLWMETQQARDSGSRPWPSVLSPEFAASAWLPRLLGARAHSARVPAASGAGSEPDHAPHTRRSARPDRAAPAHARCLPCSNHPLAEDHRQGPMGLPGTRVHLQNPWTARLPSSCTGRYAPR